MGFIKQKVPEMIPHVQAVLKEYMKGATKQGFSVSIYTF
jgi:hypothetical protein